MNHDRIEAQHVESVTCHSWCSTTTNNLRHNFVLVMSIFGSNIVTVESVLFNPVTLREQFVMPVCIACPDAPVMLQKRTSQSQQTWTSEHFVFTCREVRDRCLHSSHRTLTFVHLDVVIIFHNRRDHIELSYVNLTMYFEQYVSDVVFRGHGRNYLWHNTRW